MKSYGITYTVDGVKMSTVLMGKNKANIKSRIKSYYGKGKTIKILSVKDITKSEDYMSNPSKVKKGSWIRAKAVRFNRNGSVSIKK